jgi:prepilin-type N-terminal cleavage/methylation domain-containing protein
MLTRRGTTLVELMVALVLASVLLGAASASLLRQRRSAAWQSVHARTDAQLRGSLAAVPAALAELSAAAGDIAAGGARDSSLQLRVPVAASFACDDAVGQVTLASDRADSASLTGLASPPRAGDTLWWYSGAGEPWSARRVTEVRSVTAPCASTRAGTVAALQFILAAVDSVHRGAPVRITRQGRYSVYRAGDGSWQLGWTEWSEATGRFAAPQPVAGPFLRSLPTGERTGFRYFDADGTELPAEPYVAEVSRIARLRMTVLSPALSVDRDARDARLDSVDVAFVQPPVS